MKHYGEMIRNARLAGHMTQDDLAEQLHVTRQTVSNYETGRSEPDIETMRKLAEILELDMNELIGAGERTRRNTVWYWTALAVLVISGTALSLYITGMYEKYIMYFTVLPEMYITRAAMIPYVIFALCVILGSLAVIYTGRKTVSAGLRTLIRTAGVLYLAAMILYAVLLVYLRAHSGDASGLNSTLGSVSVFYVYHPHLIRIIGAVTGLLNGLITDREYNPLYLAAPPLVLFIFCCLKYGVL